MTNKDYHQFLNNKDKYSLSLKELDNFEKSFNITIPSDYKDFLLTYNGGILNFNIENKLLKNLEFIGLDEFLSLDEIEKQILTSGLEYYDKELQEIDFWHRNKILKLKILPFMVNGGNCEGYIGFGTKNLGHIYVTNLEFLGDKDYGLIHICNSFTEFMDNFVQVY
ncbi:MAG: SMI1/KNR4 family protein [Candidatus Sericytochromatia bacterium]